MPEAACRDEEEHDTKHPPQSHEVSQCNVTTPAQTRIKESYLLVFSHETSRKPLFNYEYHDRDMLFNVFVTNKCPDSVGFPPFPDERSLAWQPHIRQCLQSHHLFTPFCSLSNFYPVSSFVSDPLR